MRKYLLLLLVAISLTGCNSSYFEYPLVLPDKEMELDLRLAGHWVLDPAASGMDLGDYAFIQFLWDGSLDGGFAITTYEVTKDGRSSDQRIGFAQEIDGVGYLNFVRLIDHIGTEFESDKEGNTKLEYHILKYTFIGKDEVRFYDVDEDQIVAAIQKKQLSGHVFKEGHYRVSAKSDELLDFIRANDIFDYSKVRVYHYHDIGIPQH
ncbi:MAG: hypothetical protein KC897_00505 [Candidatus Omnitrophica bacterium]|nr:hypothetical protein [Candidatus Omnitrophota bacterium]MCB9721513.1 hypothetical protein [Candidatus Omnitrophota bacterium]